VKFAFIPGKNTASANYDAILAGTVLQYNNFRLSVVENFGRAQYIIKIA
jgi:hypothetical protein